MRKGLLPPITAEVSRDNLDPLARDLLKQIVERVELRRIATDRSHVRLTGLGKKGRSHYEMIR